MQKVVLPRAVMKPSHIGNRYRFVKPLGKGGMGEVACVLDRLSASEVALKRVRIDFDGAGSSDSRRHAPRFAQHSTRFVPLGQQRHSDTLPSPRIVVGASDSRKAQHLALAQEFHTLATLRHPHIISVLDYGFDSELRPFFTMELIADARPFQQAVGELSLVCKLELIAQLLSALGYLHRRGVLHRDLKPSKVLPKNTRPANDPQRCEVLAN